MKIPELNKAIQKISVPEGLSPARKANYENWINMYTSGKITEEEFNQFKKSCKTPREVYHISEMPEDMIEAIRNVKTDHLPEYLDELIEHSEEHKDDRIVQQHIDFFGLPVCVEIIKGGVKYSKSYDGKPWQREMKCDYGYFDGVTSGDGEYLDCYICDDYGNPNNKVYVIKQMRPDGSEFDESKVMIGCNSEKMAKDVYLSHCHTSKCFGGITEYTIDEFKETLDKKDGN